MRNKEVEFDLDRLYNLAEENRLTLTLENELYSFKKLLLANYELKTFFENPAFDPGCKKRALKEILPPSTSSLFKSILDLLLDRGCPEKISALSEAFSRQVALQKNLSFAEVQTASALEPETRKKIHSLAEKITQKTLVLKEKRSPEILGGFKLKMLGGKVLDATLSSKLQRLKEQITKAEA